MRVLVLAARRYNGHELWTALGVMQNRGHSPEVVSTAYEVEDEVTGQRNTIKLCIPDVIENVTSMWDALMIVSGNPEDTESFWHMPQVQKIVKEFADAVKPIAAICVSVPTVRLAARGKRVSYFPLLRSRMALLEAGAILSNISVTVDGNLVTAEHQMATEMWAELFCDVMENKPLRYTLSDSGFRAGLQERKPIRELEHIKQVLKNTGKNRIEKEDK